MTTEEIISKALEAEGILTPNVLAYALATIKHETDGTMQPIKEYKGESQAVKLGYSGGKNYYGRGYIQLTHDYNYKTIGQRIGMGDELFNNPELALNPEIAAKILAVFFKDKGVAAAADRGDFIGARKPINGTDKAQLIANMTTNYLPESTKIIKSVQDKEKTNDFYASAKSIQQEYNNKNTFEKMFNPKPAFSAENNNQQSTGVQKMDMSFLDNVKLTQGFGAKTFAFYGAGGHEGDDFRAAVGTPVKGYAGWIVDFAGQGESYYGKKVVLRNPQTGESVEYAHLNNIGVKKGQVLGNNQVIATTGNSGYRPDGQPQQAHLHVNYYSPNNKKGDFLKLAKNAGDNFPMIASVNSVIDKAKGIVSGITNPKQISAAEPIATPVGTPLKEGQPNPLLRPEQDPNQPGSYYGKSVGSYQIKPGDNLTNIARQFNTTVQDFQRQNPQITNPNMIRAGQSLNVPSAPTPTSKGSGYTIRSGDTLTSIARNLGTTVNDLVRKNGIQNPNLIRAGAKLKL